MAVRNSLWITFLVILDQYNTGCRRPFWMSENHFRSHFLPFQIDTQLYFCRETFDKVAAVGQFGFPKFTFNRNSGHFIQISIKIFFVFSAAITLDRISGHFRSIGHFGCPKFSFDGISGHFRSIQNFFF